MINNFQLKINNSTSFYILLFLTTSFLLYILFITPVNYTFDSGDGVHHYLFAKYSYMYPDFELDLWAKPVFTMLAAPFAQFGLKGIHFMQITCNIIISVLLFNMLKGFEIKFLWLIPILLTFTPIYFPEIFSGLTEIMFSLFLVAGIYLAVKEQWGYACVVFSFLPFVRQEGYFMLPIFGLVLLLTKRFLHIPLLVTGLILISYYGCKSQGSIYWVFRNNPYVLDNDIYKSGDYLFYINALTDVLGEPRKILFFIGLAFSVYLFIKNKFYSISSINSNIPLFQLLFLPVAYTTIFIASESVFWGAGIFGAMGLHRLIVCVVPLIVILTLIGINQIYIIASTLKLASTFNVIIGILLIFLINIPFKKYYWPLKLNGESAVVAEACEWFQLYGVKDHKIIFSHPYTIIGLDINPYDHEQAAEMYVISDKKKPENSCNKGEILIWDAHYGAREGYLPIGVFLNNPNFKLLKHSIPKVPFTVFENIPFEVYIFERL